MIDIENFNELMEEIREKSMGCHPISHDEGKLLEILVQNRAERNQNLNVIEIGTCVGYSTLWIAKGLIESSGKGNITAYEIDPKRAKQAQINFEKLTKIRGLVNISEIITLKNEDALNSFSELNKDIDFIFIDAKKEKYYQYLTLAKSFLKKGSIIVAHNVISQKISMESFLQVISNEKIWNTVIIPTKSGISLSVKKI